MGINMRGKKELIEIANGKAVQKMTTSRPFLVDVKRAVDVIPGMTAKTILHAGPPIKWERMCASMRGGILGAIQYEGWAENEQEAEQLIIGDGEITLSPCHHHNCIGIMAGITSPSMAVFVLEDRAHGHSTYANMRDQAVKSLRFGVYDEIVKKSLERNAHLGPVISAALRACGGVDLVSLISRSIHMGDDGHNRNTAQNALFSWEIMPHLLETGFGIDELHEVASWLVEDDRFISTAVMAACKSICIAAHGIENCSIVTVMSRNGTEWGIRVSGLDDQWFTAPAPDVDALYFPGFGPADAGLDMGDSAITETAGIGAFVMAAAPSMVEFVGGTVSDAINYTREMYEITVTKNPNFTIPYLDFYGCPTGIDILKVVRTGISPVINTAVSHKRPGVGQIGAGIARGPMKCFTDALEAFGESFENIP